jgi:flagellar biosynthesis protein FlhF
MELRTYRAATMYEALMLVRRELGPDAAVLHTREVSNRRWLGLLPGKPQIEVTASCGVNVPSRLAANPRDNQAAAIAPALPKRPASPTVDSLVTPPAGPKPEQGQAET